MKDHFQRGVPLEKLEKRQVRLIIGVLEHMVEISHRLMIMDREDKVKL